jgi:hypothetical protein
VVTGMWRTLTLFQVPTEVPPEGGGAIHTADARHRRHGDTSGASNAVPAQSANLSQRSGYTQLRVSFDASHTCIISRIRLVIFGLSKCSKYILRVNSFVSRLITTPPWEGCCKDPCISLHRIFLLSLRFYTHIISRL